MTGHLCHSEQLEAIPMLWPFPEATGPPLPSTEQVAPAESVYDSVACSQSREKDLASARRLQRTIVRSVFEERLMA